MKSGTYKYVPEFLLPSLKPKILEEIYCGEEIIGQIVGINLKELDFNNEKNLEEYILGILKIKSNDTNKLYIEDCHDLSNEIIKKVEEKTSMKIPTGKWIRRNNLPVVINEYFNSFGEDILEQELLLISNNKEETIETIRILSKHFKFITLIGALEEEKEEIYMKILDLTGLSIFQPNSIEKRIKSYDVIINLAEETDIKVYGIKRKTLVIDFSNNKPLKSMENTRISDTIIEDLCFRTLDLGIRESGWLKDKISSDLFEGLNIKDNHKFYQIFVGKEYCFMKDYGSYHLKTIGRI